MGLARPPPAPHSFTPTASPVCCPQQLSPQPCHGLRAVWFAWPHRAHPCCPSLFQIHLPSPKSISPEKPWSSVAIRGKQPPPVLRRGRSQQLHSAWVLVVVICPSLLWEYGDVSVLPQLLEAVVGYHVSLLRTSAAFLIRGYCSICLGNGAGAWFPETPMGWRHPGDWIQPTACLPARKEDKGNR